ncbi:hypothetical protein [Streptomyces albus]|uniref:hypothetical protein n=1 Tax=Streptomyces albus TaxID=1888 RepID=UPI0006E2B04B
MPFQAVEVVREAGECGIVLWRWSEEQRADGALVEWAAVRRWDRVAGCPVGQGRYEHFGEVSLSRR